MLPRRIDPVAEFQFQPIGDGSGRRASKMTGPKRCCSINCANLKIYFAMPPWRHNMIWLFCCLARNQLAHLSCFLLIGGHPCFLRGLNCLGNPPEFSLNGTHPNSIGVFFVK